MKEIQDHEKFATEADLVRAFVCAVERRNRLALNNDNFEHDWAIYPETGGFDLLLSCRRTEIQVGIEAKLTLNLKVIQQALPAYDGVCGQAGPDYRAVLVPPGPSVQKGIRTIASRIGLTVIVARDQRLSWHGTHDPEWTTSPNLPDENGWDFDLRGWHPWLPIERIKLPDYVPDVEGGKASPVALTQWKVKAIKLMILLDRFGRVTRADMKALELSPTRFTDSFNGFLRADASVGGYVRCERTPDFKAQHPRNYAEIEADFEKWCPAPLKPGFTDPIGVLPLTPGEANAANV